MARLFPFKGVEFALENVPNRGDFSYVKRFFEQLSVVDNVHKANFEVLRRVYVVFHVPNQSEELLIDVCHAFDRAASNEKDQPAFVVFYSFLLNVFVVKFITYMHNLAVIS